MTKNNYVDREEFEGVYGRIVSSYGRIVSSRDLEIEVIRNIVVSLAKLASIADALLNKQDELTEVATLMEHVIASLSEGNNTLKKDMDDVHGRLSTIAERFPTSADVKSLERRLSDIEKHLNGLIDTAAEAEQDNKHIGGLDE
jgi:chromosome segregation ATPase